jgi:hypothetical protein
VQNSGIWNLEARIAGRTLATQNGGYRASSGEQRKLQRVARGLWPLAPDRRLCAGQIISQWYQRVRAD